MASDSFAPPPLGAVAPRRRRWAWLGAALVVAGLIVGSVVAVAVIWLFPDVGSFPRASGEGVPVELAAGEWTVFVEGGLQPPRSIEGPDGANIAVRPISSRQSYSYGGRSGDAVGTITAPVDGTYLVTTAPGETIAFGKHFGRRLAAAIATGIVGGMLALGSFAVGLVIVVVNLIISQRRS
jgi:hypothetical protein